MSSLSHQMSNSQFFNNPLAEIANYDISLAGFSQPSSTPLYLPNMSPMMVFEGHPHQNSSPELGQTYNQLTGEYFYPLFHNTASLSPQTNYFDPLASLYTQAPVNTTVNSPPATTESDLFSDLIHYPTSPSTHALPSPILKPESGLKSGSKRKSSFSEQELEIEDDDSLPGDALARKRRQNTLAARRSRQRKVQKMEELELSISSLEKQKIQLETRLAVLESEKDNSTRRERESAERIRMLEAQLMEALKSKSA